MTVILQWSAMREYILTERERQVLKAYLEKDLKLNGFRSLAFCIIKAHKQLKSDFELIENLLKKKY